MGISDWKIKTNTQTNNKQNRFNSPFKLKSKQYPRAIGVDTEGYGVRHASRDDIVEACESFGMITEKELQIEQIQKELGKHGGLSYNISELVDVFDGQLIDQYSNIINKTIANLNMDMMGRADPNRGIKNLNYVYVIGSDILSDDLHEINLEANEKYANLELDFRYNDINDPNQFYYRSDHYHFVKNNIPSIFYFSGVHEDYHKPTDTAEKILYEPYKRRVKLIFHTAWGLANRDERIELN